jgi:hypothetical protein
MYHLKIKQNNKFLVIKHYTRSASYSGHVINKSVWTLQFRLQCKVLYAFLRNILA